MFLQQPRIAHNCDAPVKMPVNRHHEELFLKEVHFCLADPSWNRCVRILVFFRNIITLAVLLSLQVARVKKSVELWLHPVTQFTGSQGGCGKDATQFKGFALESSSSFPAVHLGSLTSLQSLGHVLSHVSVCIASLITLHEVLTVFFYYSKCSCVW